MISFQSLNKITSPDLFIHKYIQVKISINQYLPFKITFIYIKISKLKKFKDLFAIKKIIIHIKYNYIQIDY